MTKHALRIKLTFFLQGVLAKCVTDHVSRCLWSEMVLVVQAETALDAVIVVLRTRGMRRAVKVVVSAGDKCIRWWYGVRTLADGFGSQRATCLPMGWLGEQQAFVPRGRESLVGAGHSP